MKEKTAQELKQMLDNKEDIQLIDVRELHEHEMANIGGELIPLGTIMDNIDRIPTTKTVVIYCRSGARSGAAVSQLEKEGQFGNLYNLKGGILAYSKDIDPTLTVS